MCKRIVIICILLFLFSGCREKYHKWHEMGTVANKFYEPRHHSISLYEPGYRPVSVSNEWIGKYNLIIICSVPKEVYDQVCKEDSTIVEFWLSSDPAKVLEARIKRETQR